MLAIAGVLLAILVFTGLPEWWGGRYLILRVFLFFAFGGIVSLLVGNDTWHGIARRPGQHVKLGL